MSFLASMIRTGFKRSGMKKMFSLPQDELLKTIEKMNKKRPFFMPTDHDFRYEKRMVEGSPCLTIQHGEKPAKRAILFFFGGGMMIGPDKGDVLALKKICKETGYDAWFPFYPLCTDHCITETYKMAFECYRQMIGIYGAGNVSTVGFSSGGMLALGVAAHDNALGTPLPLPRHIVAISPGECPWNDAERARMKAQNATDVSIDYNFMASVETFMRHGETDVPLYMLAGSRGDYRGVEDIHFFYSKDEVLYGALPDYEDACKRAGVSYTVTARPGMIHCYCMFPFFREAKEDLAKIVEILKK